MYRSEFGPIHNYRFLDSIFWTRYFSVISQTPVFRLENILEKTSNSPNFGIKKYVFKRLDKLIDEYDIPCNPFELAFYSLSKSLKEKGLSKKEIISKIIGVMNSVTEHLYHYKVHKPILDLYEKHIKEYSKTKKKKKKIYHGFLATYLLSLMFLHVISHLGGKYENLDERTAIRSITLFNTYLANYLSRVLKDKENKIMNYIRRYKVYVDYDKIRKDLKGKDPTKHPLTRYINELYSKMEKLLREYLSI